MTFRSYAAPNGGNGGHGRLPSLDETIPGMDQFRREATDSHQQRLPSLDETIPEIMWACRRRSSAESQRLCQLEHPGPYPQMASTRGIRQGTGSCSSSSPNDLSDRRISFASSTTYSGTPDRSGRSNGNSPGSSGTFLAPIRTREPESSGTVLPREQTHVAQVPAAVNFAKTDEKPKKRRGNLPKAVTDHLRNWFVGHLAHPYPTEEEKQRLMHETGLNMSQISNWFINARRRNLPLLTKQAAAEAALRQKQGETSPDAGKQTDKAEPGPNPKAKQGEKRETGAKATKGTDPKASQPNTANKAGRNRSKGAKGVATVGTEGVKTVGTGGR